MEDAKKAIEKKNEAQDSYSRGEYQQSIEYAKQWLDIAKKVREKKWEAEAHNVLAGSYYWVGDYEKSIEHGKEALSFAKKVGNKEEEALAYNVLAVSYYEIEDYQRSIEHGEQVPNIAKEVKDKELEAAVYNALAKSYFMSGDYKQSISYSKKEMNIAEEEGKKKWKAAAYNTLAKSYRRLGDNKQADKYSKLESSLQDPSYSTEITKAEAAATGGFANGSSGSPQDNDDEKELTERGLKEQADSGDFKETKEEEFDEALGSLPSSSSAARYKMTADPTGLTLIINNEAFDDSPQKQRHGSDKDVSTVKDLFSSLGFLVSTKQNLTTQKLKDELDSVACSNHSKYDCFVLWLMSHGKSGEILCSDDLALPIQTAHDMLSKCATLKGKPKLFFIQACRGDEEDEFDFAEVSTASQVDAGRPSSTAVHVPTHADFLYSYSVVDHHASYRNPKAGSYYVRSVVEAFKERVDHDHLIDILTLVSEKVSKMFPISSRLKKKVKTISEFSSTLRKEVWFSFKQSPSIQFPLN